jgi:hypothetical protein
MDKIEIKNFNEVENHKFEFTIDNQKFKLEFMDKNDILEEYKDMSDEERDHYIYLDKANEYRLKDENYNTIFYAKTSEMEDGRHRDATVEFNSEKMSKELFNSLKENDLTKDYFPQHISYDKVLKYAKDYSKNCIDIVKQEPDVYGEDQGFVNIEFMYKGEGYHLHSEYSTDEPIKDKIYKGDKLIYESEFNSIKDFKQKGICKIDKKEIDKELFTELKKTNIIPFDLNYEKIKDFKSLFNNMKITTERNPQFDFLER